MKNTSAVKAMNITPITTITAIRARTGRRAVRGATMIEASVHFFVVCTVMTLCLSLSSAAARTMSHRSVEVLLASSGRAGMDETLQETRAASRIVPSYTLSGVACTTNVSNLILEAPGYDPATALVVRTGAPPDVILFRHDPSAKTLTQTTVVQSGSARPRRPAFVLARNVHRVDYIYYARDRFRGTGLTGVFTLKVPADEVRGVRAYVNGALVTGTYLPATRTVTLLTPPASGADVQFIYAVDPTRSGGADLSNVSEVEMTLLLAENDDRSIRRSLTLTGGARLRNRRS